MKIIIKRHTCNIISLNMLRGGMHVLADKIPIHKTLIYNEILTEIWIIHIRDTWS